MRRKIVNRQQSRPAGAQLSERLAKDRPIDGGWVIEIKFSPPFRWKIGTVAIEIIEGNKQRFAAQPLHKSLSQPALAAATAADDSNVVRTMFNHGFSAFAGK